MCPQGKWEKVSNGLWVKSMSPFDHKLLDIRMRSCVLNNNYTIKQKNSEVMNEKCEDKIRKMLSVKEN